MNSAGTIRRMLESIRQQTFCQFEHIVCDGGSTDGTLAILEEYSGRYPMKYLSGPDTGIADAMNKGVALARGKYVLFIHADDELAGPEVLQRAHTLLRQEECDIYSFPVVVPGPAGRRRFYRPIRVHWWHHFKTIIPHQGAFVHRRVFERIGGFRPELKIAMDYDFFYRAFQNRSRARFGRMVVARMGAGGVSGDPKHLAARLEEEYAIQRHNERHPGWRAAQAVWRALYTLYKQRGCSPPLSSRNTRS
jgi:glycosyltransferase involved in cell wall biosynthesis